MRKILALIASAFVALALAQAANAQAINLPDGDYPSASAYLVGTWKWERAEPRQTMIMRFGRDGGFFFHNFTTGLQHYGQYSVTGDKFHIVINRSCNDNGNDCQSRTPALELDEPFAPVGGGVFMSASERWERQRQ